jgi:hypothetical protein
VELTGPKKLKTTCPTKENIHRTPKLVYVLKNKKCLSLPDPWRLKRRSGRDGRPRGTADSAIQGGGESDRNGGLTGKVGIQLPELSVQVLARCFREMFFAMHLVTLLYMVIL